VSVVNNNTIFGLLIFHVGGCGVMLTCGPGTVEDGGSCIVDETGYVTPDGIDPLADPELDDDTDVRETDDTDEAFDTDRTVGADTDMVETPEETDVPSFGAVLVHLGDVTFTTPASMRAFCNTYQEVYGTVHIAGSSITELTELSCLTGVYGALILDASQLTSAVLPALRLVDLDLVLEDTSSLAVLQLESLASVGGDLRLAPEVTSGVLSVVALPQLSWVGGGLAVVGNDGLQVLGLPALQSVGGTFEVRENATLTDVQSVGQLDSVGGDLLITDNPMLPTSQAEDLGDGVRSVGGVVEVSGNGPG
jgi:hypothetical protein